MIHLLLGFSFFYFPLIVVIGIVISLKFNKNMIMSLVTKKGSYIFLLAFLYSFFFNFFIERIDEKDGCFTVDRSLSYSDYGVSFVDDNVKVNIYSPETKLKYGDVICPDKVEYKGIENKYNNFSSFDYQRYMKSKNVFYEVEIDQVQVVKKKENLVYRLLNFRDDLIGTNNNLTNALILGEKDFSDQVNELLQNVGVMHLLAISGLHLAIIIQIIKYVLQFFKINETTEKIVLSLFLPSYLILTGFSIGAMRAGVMELIKLIGPKINSVVLWLFTIDFFLLINPNNYLNLGFQLSFGISFIIIIINYFELKINIWHYGFVLYFISLPLTINLSNTFNIASPLISMILSPLLYILILLSIIQLFVHSQLLESIIIFFGQVSILIIYVGNFWSVTIKDFTNWEQLLYLCFGVVGFINMIKRRKINYKFYQPFLIIILFIKINFSIFTNVHIIDIGQGDATLIQGRMHKSNILIDTGPETSSAELIDYLESIGLTKIDALFITHLHDDHYGGYHSLINNFQVDYVFYPFTIQESFEKSKLPAVTVDQGTKYVPLKCGDQLTSGNLKINVLNPCVYDENENNNSLVLRIEQGKSSWLFTGDLEEDVERKIVEQYGTDLKSTNLKVGHHGSITSSSEEFMGYVQPKNAYISVGQDNRYGHPSEEVIERLLENGSNVYRTDLNGGMIVRF